MKLLNYIFHIIIVCALTLLTQIGGLLWILNYGILNLRKHKQTKIKSFFSFLVVYLLATLVVVPLLAKIGGRVPLPLSKSNNLIPHNIMTPLLNRHYVKPLLRSELLTIAGEVNLADKRLKLSYLDANFPFIDGFPLLPHRSHDDGRKVDVCFYYLDDNQAGNKKPARSGYGSFVHPTTNEFDQTKQCKSKGYWQYDFTKYLTLGTNDNLIFDSKNTKRLINLILAKKSTQKLFIEPHLVKRMNLNHAKIRFQGCQAVRHDDHIHFQIK